MTTNKSGGNRCHNGDNNVGKQIGDKEEENRKEERKKKNKRIMRGGKKCLVVEKRKWRKKKRRVRERSLSKCVCVRERER